MTTTTASTWHDLGALARLAPTPHNTQPYRIRPRGPDRADLVLLCERLLPAEDRGNAYVLSAFGIFAATLERAARACGWQAEIAARDELDGAALDPMDGELVVGTVTLRPAPREPAEAMLLAMRRTSRLPYRDQAVDPETLAVLAGVVTRAGHTWRVVSEPDDVRRVLRQNATAIVDNLQRAEEREELRRWHRLGATPAHGDGLWQVPMQQPAWQLRAAFTAPWLFSIAPLRSLATARYLRAQGATRHVAVIGGEFSTWAHQIAAGRMLFALWLAMAQAGVYMQPFGSMLTHPRHAAWVEAELGVARPWLILRLGYSDVPPAAPRLASIVIA